MGPRAADGDQQRQDGEREHHSFAEAAVGAARAVPDCSTVTFERIPLSPSTSSTGRITRKPTWSASVSHQTLSGMFGSCRIHSGTDLSREPLRHFSAIWAHEPPRAVFGKRLAVGGVNGSSVGRSSGYFE